MDYIENNLTYEDYVALRTSVDWCNFNEEQTRKSVSNSLYTITVMEDNRAIAMGRMIGDGMYFLIVDVVVILQEYRWIAESLNTMANFTKCLHKKCLQTQF